VSTVLIAEPDQLAALKTRPDYTDAKAFTDAETPAALEAIIIGRPEIVAIERIFAKKSRGAALINRIKADTSLEGVEIRIVSADSGASKSSGRGGSGVAPAPVPVAGAAGAAVAVAAAVMRRRQEISERTDHKFLIGNRPRIKTFWSGSLESGMTIR